MIGFECKIRDGASTPPYSVLRKTLLGRDDRGFGAEPPPAEPGAALIYPLSGD
ncbi:MAG: hypothetical protein P4M15_02470 [Alphaproteobacteria bacterium]|nr:hypothetical protein [Alphaproteobacteria bacterium]